MATSATVAPSTGSNSGNKLGGAISYAYSFAPSSTIVVSGTSFIGAVQALTPAQVNSFSSVHAEGYSSNMTINLEQLGHVTNTVMDRIHAPVSGKTATSAAYEVYQGRYFWIDASTMKGGVDSYDNLAGFGYQLSSIVLGRDLLRDPSGGFGVFGGVGYTTMTQMDQVAQSFSSTNYYLGLYGGKYLSNDFKLSGAAGYVYSDSTAARANPDIGNFTGGTAKSQYQSNGAYAALKLSRPILASQHVTLTPFIGASYVQSWMNQANESGGRDLIAFASGQCAQNDALPAQVLE